MKVIRDNLVRPLEWEDRDDTETYGGDGAFGSNAKTPFSDYWTYWNGKQEKPWALMLGRTHLGWYDTEAEAKAAAQADFDARVLSCISHNAGEIEAGGEVADDRVEAASRLRQWARKHFGPWITHSTAKRAIDEILALKESRL